MGRFLDFVFNRFFLGMIATAFFWLLTLAGGIILGLAPASATFRVAEASHSIFNVALIVLSTILVVVAIVFLVRKNLQYANYTYVGYVLLAIIGSIYGYVGLQDAVQLVQDESMRLTVSIGSKAVSIFYIVINVLFLALVFYKMWRQQKALAEEEETEELA